jgi:AraC-like DNA-binding protein
MRSFHYEVFDDGITWSSTSSEPLAERWHPQPYVDRIIVSAGVLRWNGTPVSVFSAGPGTAIGCLESSGTVHLKGRRTWTPQQSRAEGRTGRRLHRSLVGVSRRRLASLQAVQSFYDAGCVGAPGGPLRDHIDYERFYDQPHFVRVFRSVTGMTPTQALAASSPLMEALMAATYNARGASLATVTV